jgi:Xaa-Pro aminopeptidase
LALAKPPNLPIRKAIAGSVAAHLAAMRVMKPGRHEYEIAALMQYELQMRGCERLAYRAIVGSGINSASERFQFLAIPLQPLNTF